MKKYTTAIFDLGLTLIYSPRVENFIKVAKKFDMDLNEDEVQSAFTFADSYFMKNKPGILGLEPKEFYRDYLGIMFAYLHRDPDIQLFYETLFREHPPRKEWRLYDETISFLKKLKNKGLKIGLLSNWDKSARDILNRLDLTDYFDSIVISSEIGVEKPEQKAFQHSLNDLGVDPEEAFYVGDNFYDDVKGGNKAGLKVFLINRTDSQRNYDEGNFIEIASLMSLFDFLESEPI